MIRPAKLNLAQRIMSFFFPLRALDRGVTWKTLWIILATKRAR